MEKNNDKLIDIKEGIIAGMPVAIGYFPIAMAFGILSKTTGITLVDSVLFSVMVFAGASQFMALGLIGAGVGFGQIILTTLLVNMRHFLMSASIVVKIEDNMKGLKPLIAFGITDEVFSVASFRKGKLSKNFMIFLELCAYLSWVAGTAVGFVVGQVLPEILKSSMGVALYAMFTAILIPEGKKSREIIILAAISGGLNTFLSYFKLLPQGWNMVVVIIFTALLGTFIFEEKGVTASE